MDAQAIIAQLTEFKKLPKAALQAAAADRAVMAPRFIEVIEDYLARPTEERSGKTPIFFIFHLLGDWREKAAYRPLTRLLRLPGAEIGHLLGDAVTSTSNRVIASVFDGDPQPIFDVVLDPAADEYVRSRMCEALSYLGLTGQIERSTLLKFLRDCFVNLGPQEGCYVWVGWQLAISRLGYRELTSLVEMAFKRGWIDSWWTGVEHFHARMAEASSEYGRAKLIADTELTPFGDTITELSRWSSFSEPDPKQLPRRPKPAAARVLDSGRQPARASRVGRNEACPCGSGRKHKKCCGAVQNAAGASTPAPEKPMTR